MKKLLLDLLKHIPFGKQDAIALLKGLLITMGGAGLTYLGSYLSGHDFGAYTPIVVVIGSFLVNFGRKAADGVKA